MTSKSERVLSSDGVVVLRVIGRIGTYVATLRESMEKAETTKRGPAIDHRGHSGQPSGL